ncbi:MAG: hypothetical protein V1690_02565 [Candidatus Moraniibacteriota bacterium]
MDTMSGESHEKSALIVYTKFCGDITKAVQGTTAISKIRPENRVAVEGGMYVASCTNLKLEPSGFTGALSLTYYRELAVEGEKEGEEVAKKNLVKLVLDKFFKATKDKLCIAPDIAYGGKNYEKVWRTCSDDYHHWIILHGGVWKKAIGKMKCELVKERELVFSNALLQTLFTPILNSLLEVHTTLGKF